MKGSLVKSGRIVLASSLIIIVFTAMITMSLVASHGAGIESNGFHRFFLERFGARGILLSVSLAAPLVVTFIWLLGRYWPRGGSVLALAFLMMVLVDLVSDLNFLFTGFPLFGNFYVFCFVVVPALALVSSVLFLFMKVKPFEF